MAATDEWAIVGFISALNHGAFSWYLDNRLVDYVLIKGGVLSIVNWLAVDNWFN